MAIIRVARCIERARKPSSTWKELSLARYGQIASLVYEYSDMLESRMSYFRNRSCRLTDIRFIVRCRLRKLSNIVREGSQFFGSLSRESICPEKRRNKYGILPPVFLMCENTLVHVINNYRERFCRYNYFIIIEY